MLTAWALWDRTPPLARGPVHLFADLSRGLYSGNGVFSGLVLGLRGRGGRRRACSGASGNTHQSELSRERLAGPPPLPGRWSSQEPRQRVRAPLSSPSDSEAPSETSLLRVSTKVKVQGSQVPPRGEGPRGSRPAREHAPHLALLRAPGDVTGLQRSVPAQQGPLDWSGPPVPSQHTEPAPRSRTGGGQPASRPGPDRACARLRLLGPLRAQRARSQGRAWTGRGFLRPPLAWGSHPTSERGSRSGSQDGAPREGRPCSFPAEPPESQRASWAPPGLETARFSQAFSET